MINCLVRNNFIQNNIKVNAEQNSLPYKFVRVKPGTHDINITAREGETNVPRYILYYGVGESEWVPWPGSTFEFYDFPAPGILPVNFPADYCDFERRDTLWPAGYNGVDLEIRGVKEFKVSVLNQYIFHWVPPFKDSNGVISIKNKAITQGKAPNANFVRLRNYEGDWTFQKLAANKVKVSTTGFADPEGAIPQSVTNMLVEQQPYQMLQKMKAELAKNKALPALPEILK